MRVILLLALLALLAGVGLAAGYEMQGPLNILAVTPNRSPIPRYERFDLSLNLSATYMNPFDPAQIDVYARFSSPTGKQVRVNGFFSQDYTRTLVNANETLTPAGAPRWKIRFTPDAVGRWTYQVFARDRSGEVHSGVQTLQVTPATHPGFIRRSTRNPKLFAYDNGAIYFPVGENMCWSGSRGTYDYEDWLTALGKAGGNWIRIWMCSWHTGLEWSAQDKYAGLGSYNLQNAWTLDTVFDLAERNGISVMLCLGTYGEFTTGGFFNEGQWKDNPYNIANGGPCRTPEEFWTNSTARQMYQRRLRYLAARYGCRTNLHAWEFWNEAKAPASWVGEMARYMKGTGEFAGQPADPYVHLLTTTYGDDAVWRLPEIDFTQSHNYGTANIADHAPVIHNDARRAEIYGKPHLMGEFGIDWRDSDKKYDPDGLGINMHNGLWASVMAGNAGTAMLWWWDSYVHPKNLYRQFTPVRAFVDTVPWAEGTWAPVKAEVAITQGEETFTDLDLPGGDWGKSEERYTIKPWGVLDDRTLPGYLYSTGKADLRTTPVFTVDYPHPGRFIVQVGKVSVEACLRISLDGKLAREVRLSANPPQDGTKPEYERTEFKQEWGIFQAEFNKEYGIDVPAGTHTITLENTSGDWLSLNGIRLTRYRSSRYISVRAIGMMNGTTAILWLQNPLSTWQNALEKREIIPLHNLAVTVPGLADGRYVVEMWDTTQGGVTSQQTVRCANHVMQAKIPELRTDIALRIVPAK